MKKLLLILLMPVAFNAQEKVTFKVISDDPEYVSDKLVNVYVLSSFGKASDISFGLGADGVWKIMDGIEAQGDLSYSPAFLLPYTGFHMELGGAYSLTRKTKVKDTKVVTDWTDSRGQVGNVIYENKSVKWIDSKATYLSKIKGRGGIYIHKSAYSIKNKGLATEGNFSMTGVYLGFEKSIQAALISEVNGVKGITSGLTRIYADALVMPLTRVDGTGNGFGLGGRIGFWAIFNPSKGKNASPERLAHYQAYQTMFFKAEVGYRPFDKYYFSMGFGLNIFKNR